MATCLKQSITDKTITVALSYTAAYVIPLGFGYNDSYACTFTYSIADKSSDWLACVPDTEEEIEASLDAGEMIFLGRRHSCCPNAHVWGYQPLDGYEEAGARTNVWYGGGSPPFPPPVYLIGGTCNVDDITIIHCRKGDGNLTYYMSPAEDATAEDSTPTASIVTQADPDDTSVVAEFSIVYDGTGSHFDGASQFTWTDPLGKVFTIDIARTSGNPEEWWPFLNVSCAGIDALRITDGFLVKLIDKKYAGLEIAAPVLVTNSMTRTEYSRGSNHARAVINLYKRSYDEDGNVADGIDTSFLWAQYIVEGVIPEDADSGFTLTTTFSGTADDGSTYSGTVTMKME